MENPKYSTQKNYLNKQKQLRVWFSPEEFDAFKAATAANGSSIHAEIHKFVEAYLKNN